MVEVTTATTAKSTTPAAVHQWIRSAIHAWQQLLCGTTGKSLFKNGGFPVRKLLNGQRGTNQVATKPAKCYVFSSQCHGTTCLPEEQHLRPCYGWPTWLRSPGNPHGYVVKHNMFYGPMGPKCGWGQMEHMASLGRGCVLLEWAHFFKTSTAKDPLPCSTLEPHKNHLCLSVYGAAGRYIACVYSSLLTSRPKSNQGDVSILGTARFPRLFLLRVQSQAGDTRNVGIYEPSCSRAEPLKRRGSNPPEIQDGSGTS